MFIWLLITCLAPAMPLLPAAIAAEIVLCQHPQHALWFTDYPLCRSRLMLAHLILPFTALLLPSTTMSPSFSACCCTSAPPASCPDLDLLPALVLLLRGLAAWAAGLLRWLDGSWLAAACTAACMLSNSRVGELSTLPSSCQRLQLQVRSKKVQQARSRHFHTSMLCCKAKQQWVASPNWSHGAY
jgi:hypothetical protein